MEIRHDDLRGPEIAALLQAHLDDMHRHSPPESVHALDLDALRAPDITFWTVWDEGVLLGCGALRELDPQHGEIKSMRTDERHRRRGVATVMLDHIIEEARRRGYTRLSLETGTPAAFDAARLLYASRGFTLCPPFGDYKEDPYSVCMTLELGQTA
ncbi:GNAT family N-acetyltransferase [Sphingosinicella sp.]|jgi:putative acetyltransferase|uniref:GNAT family N-acetyltransferase n=1 Tax=Sphingosinicella sp. TaxID=1917971 RepID=UPI00184F3221|nr:GNAT family N-acetyltransferase [Sphingosinicella sp.]MBA4759946.1 GNAT family N-acetyltransferase [Sphingosinicella sp.]MEA3539745.1 GNAT family N-acetyltransferase [Pseudomonadota bacterium]